ncbi:methyltransferase family protein [Actinomadura flavalba]|uniref:methyltransferase family protein n=1 Tax=Actinomadura flavalba TaxID=1120938 RepID=UPI00037C9DBD|nr:methyltransferase [Actinomadura flavalba]
MTDPALIRGVALFVPLLATAALLRRPSRREVAALVLGVAWNLAALSGVNALALRAGWWTFAAEGGVVAGVPVDLLLGWAFLWGGAAVLALRALPWPLVAGAAVWVDLAVMPLGEPVVLLGGDWLLGESVAAVAALVPGLLLARWTLDGRHLRARVALQAVAASVLMLGLPIALSDVPSRPTWALALVGQAALVPLAVTAAAVAEFARAGGTPLPYDPPPRLVTTGPYAYVRNPMQTGMTAVYLLLALLDPVFLLGAATAAAYGAGLASWHENALLTEAHGAAWTTYRRTVRPWLPRLRGAQPDATIWIAATCGRCRPVEAWLRARNPVRLALRPAERHPSGLRRMTYERDDGLTADGPSAWCHAVTHLHLGWAVLAWTLLLPGPRHFTRLCADAFGAGPAAEPARSR